MTHSHHTRNGTPHLDGDVTETLLRTRRFLQPTAVSADRRTLHQIGGREADTFYRDRWSHDKVVRSTHGVNCTGSCSWKVYVKDGIITWETQQTDYPSVGPGPARSTSRAAARAAPRSPGTPTRPPACATRTPAASLLEMYREAKARLGDPVAAWARSSRPTPSSRRRYQRARGKGGLVRAAWDEVAGDGRRRARAHHQASTGPDRVAGLLPDPGDVDGRRTPPAPGSSR